MNVLIHIIKRLELYKALGEKTFEQLSEADFHYRAGEEDNSIAIIVQHLYGNMMSRFTNLLTEDGEKSWRKRDEEFEPMEMTKQDLLDCWATCWSLVLSETGKLSEADLEREITIRGEKLNVFDALLRQLAHSAYHVGQIVYIGKMLKEGTWKTLSLPKRKKE